MTQKLIVDRFQVDMLADMLEAERSELDSRQISQVEYTGCQQTGAHFRDA